MVWQLLVFPLQYLQFDTFRNSMTAAVFAATSCEREPGEAIGYVMIRSRVEDRGRENAGAGPANIPEWA